MRILDNSLAYVFRCSETMTLHISDMAIPVRTSGTASSYDMQLPQLMPRQVYLCFRKLDGVLLSHPKGLNTVPGKLYGQQ